MKTKIFLFFLALVALVYFLGPQPSTPDYQTDLPFVPAEADSLELYISRIENQHNIKQGNRAHIHWADDSLKQSTDFVLVYLHGFSASHHEGYPLHVNLAKRYGCNLYLSRLHDHGIDTTESLLRFSAEEFYESACKALAIGTKLGDKVILLSTSTGGTTALKLAAEFPEVHALINLSPNVRINDPFAFLLNDPWGLQLANITMGGQYRYIDGGPEYAKYWNTKYRNEAIVQLQVLIESTMVPGTFEKVKQPVFNGFYFASDTAQDRVVRVESIRWMHKILATPDDQKVLHAFDTPRNHVLASPIKSKDVAVVEKTVSQFMEDVLQMKPVSED